MEPLTTEFKHLLLDGLIEIRSHFIRLIEGRITIDGRTYDRADYAELALCILLSKWIGNLKRDNDIRVKTYTNTIIGSDLLRLYKPSETQYKEIFDNPLFVPNSGGGYWWQSVYQTKRGLIEEKIKYLNLVIADLEKELTN